MPRVNVTECAITTIEPQRELAAALWSARFASGLLPSRHIADRDAISLASIAVATAIARPAFNQT